MRIVLVNPPWAETYGEFKAAAKTRVCYPPLGLCYISGVLKREGHDVKILDCDLEGNNPGDIVDSILSFTPDLVGFTASTTVFHRARELARGMRSRGADIPLVVGGPHVTLLHEKAMKEGEEFKYGVYGEGEETILELVFALGNGKKVDGISGLIFRVGDEVIKNPPRTYLDDLDSIPFPDFENLALKEYTTYLPRKGITSFLPVSSSRGCPFACMYCSADKIMGKRVRNRSVGNVLNELSYIKNTLGISHIAFTDETLMLNRERISALCHGVMERKLDITMEGWTRPETVDRETIAVMKKAGFLILSLGIESGDPEISKIIGRKFNNDAVTKAFDIIKEAGIETAGSIMIGHPYETKKTVKNTFRFIRSIKNCDQIYINITTPYPGTKLHDMALRGEGGMRILTEDYSQYRKYGNAVISVNDLSRNDLIKLQKIGFILFFLSPRRIYYNIKRSGVKPAILNSYAFLKNIYELLMKVVSNK